MMLSTACLLKATAAGCPSREQGILALNGPDPDPRSLSGSSITACFRFFLIPTVHIDCQICLSVKNPASPNSTPGTVPGFPNKIELSMDKLEEVNGGFALYFADPVMSDVYISSRFLLLTEMQHSDNTTFASLSSASLFALVTTAT